jgi:uncharacterized membrane protein YfcA
VDKNTTKQDKLMDYIDFFIFFAVSAIGGAINSVAGGGTFLTFPVFILNGLSPLQANVMSTIALCPGSIASAYAYRSQLDIDRALLKQFMLVNLIGSIIGTAILLTLPEVTFERAVPWLLLFATLLFTFGGRANIPLPLRERVARIASRVRGKTIKSPLSSVFLRTYFVSPRKTVLSLKGRGIALQFLIAIYGGYFGAGQGILMLAMLQLLGFTDIHRMNALKVVMGSAINVVAMVVFIFAGKVVWALAPVMILGAVLGGYLGAHGALKISPQKIRWLVSAIGFAMTAYFFLR